MGFLSLAFFLYLPLLLSTLAASQQPNTDGFFISDFFTKMGAKAVPSSSPVCSWTGVSCDPQTNRVTGLRATGLGLTGPIPERTVGKLTKLEYLDLSNNYITSLSSDIWELGSSLKRLNLSFNQINGSLSNNIGNFGRLERLDLSHNRFNGEVPTALGSITNLSVLNLSDNRFSGLIPNEIFGCKSLVSIDFSSNLLNGTVPDGFGTALSSLKSLNLASNGFTGGMPDLSNLNSLTYLNLSSNLFQGLVIGIFWDSLETIDLSNNQLQGNFPLVNNGSSLSYLDFSMNGIIGQFVEHLDQFPLLKHLNLAFNRFSDQNFPQLEQLSGLEYLNLSRTRLRGPILSDFSQLVNLNTLDLSQNYITGQIPNFSIDELRILDLSVNNLTGEIPEPLEKKLPSMERFNFSYNNLTICDTQFSLQEFNTSFIGSRNDCPIAVNPDRIKNRDSKHKRLGLALAISLSVLFLVLGLLFLAIGCRRKRNNNTNTLKPVSYKEEQSVSGPFSFQTDSTTWVADVKQPTSVPVIVFEKPLLNLTFADLLAATSSFDRGTLLAEGRFGPVYRGFLQGGTQVAVKVLVHGSTMADQDAERELERLGRIKHPNLVPLTGYCLAGEQRIAIFEYMENGNLHHLLHDLPLGVQQTEDWSTDTWDDGNGDSGRDVSITTEGTTTWRFRHRIALGSARALAFLHHGCIPHIVHRDVKASSIYFNSCMEPRLADFGLSMIAGTNPEEEKSLGSPGYAPPEFSDAENAAATTKSDVYGFGVVLFELITGKKPLGDEYPEGRESSLVSWARVMVKRNLGLSIIDPKIRETGSEKEMEEALRIAYLCTADLPSKRPAMQQIVGLLKDIEPKGF